MISFVQQEPWLFPGTVKENILLGRPDATDEEVIAAARDANAHDFIARLPDGYETLIDEKGSNLSGGEKQRICLARAFLKNAPILLLDEPTSAVDAESEKLIRQSLEMLGQRHTVVTVSHTEVLSRDADVVIELQPSKG